MPPYPYWGSNPPPGVGASACYQLCYEDDNVIQRNITFARTRLGKMHTCHLVDSIQVKRREGSQGQIGHPHCL